MKRVHVKRLVSIDGKKGLLLSNGDVLEGVTSVELYFYRDECPDLSVRLQAYKDTMELEDSIKEPEVIDL